MLTAPEQAMYIAFRQRIAARMKAKGEGAAITREDLLSTTPAEQALLSRVRSFTMLRTHDSREIEETSDKLVQYSASSFDKEAFELGMAAAKIRGHKGQLVANEKEHPELDYLQTARDGTVEGLEELTALFWRADTEVVKGRGMPVRRLVMIAKCAVVMKLQLQHFAGGGRKDSPNKTGLPALAEYLFLRRPDNSPFATAKLLHYQLKNIWSRYSRFVDAPGVAVTLVDAQEMDEHDEDEDEGEDEEVQGDAAEGMKEKEEIMEPHTADVLVTTSTPAGTAVQVLYEDQLSNEVWHDGILSRTHARSGTCHITFPDAQVDSFKVPHADVRISKRVNPI